MSVLHNYLLKLWHDAASHNNKMLSSFVEVNLQAKILDLGCGNGVITHERFAGKIANPDLFGIEIDQKDAQVARKYNLKVKVTNVEKKFPFLSNSFDIVSANQLIEHLVDTDRFLQEIYRVLKPGGYLLLATENLASWHNIAALLLGWHPFSLHASNISNVGNPFSLGKTGKFSSHSRHIKVYTLRSLVETVELHGFAVEQKFGSGYYPSPPLLARVFARMDANHAAFIGLKARKGRRSV